jgi:hypothetical protein
MRRVMRRVAFVSLLVGCGSSSGGSPPVTVPVVDAATPDAAGGGADALVAADAGSSGDQGEAGAAPGDGGETCSVILAAPPDEGANHVAECAPITPASNPPASGNHYPVWPVFRVYTRPVPWGFLIHGMEHGAVVVAYNCPNGCADEVAKATKLVQAWPPKDGCARPPIIMVPDPGLDGGIRWAAAAWDHTLRATCFNREAIARFISEHSNMGPEFFPTDCGTLDREETGWCP